MNDLQIRKNKLNKYFHSTAFLTSHLPLYCVGLSICTFLLHPNNLLQTAIILIINAILIFGIALGGIFCHNAKRIMAPWR